MTYDAKSLAKLLPAIYRFRDGQHPDGERPLEELIKLLAEQIQEIEENLEQLYDDQFIETCADWVVPYIGDLVGCRLLDDKVPEITGRRAEVANTIGYRRRKGTAAMLEDLAQDVTGWNARVVEFFERLTMTQHLNHVRLKNLTLTSLKNASSLEMLSSPFEPFARMGEVRTIRRRRGKYNIPNIGIFLWRLNSYSLTLTPACRVDKTDDRRFFFSPLGQNMPLFTNPVQEEERTHLADPANVPLPIGRRLLSGHLKDYYGQDKSLHVEGFDDNQKIVICDLSDRGAALDWGPAPKSGEVAVDPVLGRLVFGDSQTKTPRVTCYYGFSADMGGGDYERRSSFAAEEQWDVVKVPDDQPSIQMALKDIADNGKINAVVEITDNGRYQETLTGGFSSDQKIEIRAANEKRPLVELQKAFEINGDRADVILNGLLISGEKIKISGKVGTVRIRHCTLVPGLGLKQNGDPKKPGLPSIEVGSEIPEIEIDHSIVGAVRLTGEGKFILTDSILDATNENLAALAGVDKNKNLIEAGVVQIIRSTVIGQVHAVFLKLACNSIFLASTKSGDGWSSAVTSKKLQDGCVRFSYVPWDSRVSRRHRCQPTGKKEAERIRPRFTSIAYGRPGYGQLVRSCPKEIRRGADDGSEMGAFHDVYAPQRETNLRVRLEEYLRFGLEAGIFYAT